MALAGSSQISILRQNGKEAMRLSGPAGTLPWANPANYSDPLAPAIQEILIQGLR